MKKIEKYQQYRNEAALELLREEPLLLFRCEAEFLSAMKNLPEQAVFLDEDVRKKLECYCGQMREDAVITLASHKTTEEWNSEEQIRKAKIAMDIVAKKKVFRYKNRTFSGKCFRGLGYPISIEVDKYTHSWYLNFVDMEQETAVLAKLERLEFEIVPQQGDGISDKKTDEILESRRTGFVKLHVQNRRNAIQRACAAFAVYKRKMQFDREKDEMQMEIFYYDFEEAAVKEKILSLGCYAKVSEPEQMRQRIKSEIERVLKNYIDGD